MAHPQTNFSSNFQGVDPPLEGYWHDDPIPCGSGNVVTDIHPNPAGVPVVVKGLNALTAEDIANKLDNTGDASNTTATFTAASTRTNIASGEKLSVLFGKIAKWFGDLGTAAFKVLVTTWSGTPSDNNVPSEKLVKDSLDSKQDTLPSISGKAGKVLKVNSGATGLEWETDDNTTYSQISRGSGAGLAPGLPSGSSTTKFLREDGTWEVPNYPSVPSVINNLTSTSTTDALSAAQGKVLNEKFPTFGFASFNGTDVGYKAVGYIEPPTEQYGNVYLEALVTYSLGGGGIVSSMELVKFNIRRDDTTYSNRFERKLIFGNYQGSLRFKAYYSDGTHKIWLYAHKSVSDNTYCGISISVLNVHGWEGSAKTNAYKLGSYNIENDPGIPELVAASATISAFSAGQVGTPSQPVYVGPNGQVLSCTGCATLKTNTATLYISGYYNNTPVYHVKNIKNGCVNYVHVKDTLSSSCNLTIEAPVLAADEEYDYVVVFDTFTNNSLVGNIDVENCKTTGHFENGVFVHDAMSIPNATPAQVPMIIVTGNVAKPQWYDRV